MRLLSLALLALALAGPARGQALANTNGGFESSPVGAVADLADGVEGWDLEVNAPASAAFAVVDDVTHTGDRALRVSVGAVGPNAYDIQAVATPVTVEPGATYTLSVWARTGGGGAQASFTVGNAAFAEYGRLSNQAIGPEWQEYSFAFTVTDGETEIRAPLHLSLSRTAGDDVYLDDLAIAEQEVLVPIAEGAPKFLGNLYSQAQRPGFESYWNQVTPENAGKWGSVERTRDDMAWGELDAAYALARDNGWPFRFHVLVWGNQQPTWMRALPPDQQLEEIEEWFRAVAARYPDLDYLEVVNEPLHDPPTDQPGDAGSGGYYDALGGAGATGWDWVIRSFELAREIFPPETRLMLNDYNIVSSLAEARRYREIVGLLQARGLIDAVGVQGHAFSTRTGAPIGAVLDLLAETGLPIQVTELDVDGNPGRSPTLSDDASDQIQLTAMQRVFPTVWQHPAVEGVTLWGWREGHWRTEEDAFLIRPDGSERPALAWLRTYVADNPVAAEATAGGARAGLTVAPNPLRSAAEVGFRLAAPAAVTLTLHDLLGRRLRTLADGPFAAGEHRVRLAADGLPAGVYLARLAAGGDAQTLRVVVAR